MSSQHQQAGGLYHDIAIGGDTRVHMGHVYNLPQISSVTPPALPPSPLSTVPFRRDPDYVHRHSLEEEIHKQLSAPAARVALVGFGGLGKSQLAIEYSYRLREQSPEWWVIWIHASSAARFEQSVRDALDCLKVCDRGDSNADSLQLFANWLHDDQQRKWLIVLDNVDDATFLLGFPSASKSTAATSGKRLIDYLPVFPNGKLLVTSRARFAALEIVDDKDIITIEPMSELHASALAETKLGGHSAPHENSELIQALEYVPLAITQAAAYIRQKIPRVTVRKYLDVVARIDAAERSILERDERDLRRDREANNAILLTLQISMEHIEKIRPSASDLLSLMSCFDRQAIPESLLRRSTHNDRYFPDCSLRENSCNSDLTGPDHNCEGSNLHFDEDFEDDLAMLRSYSFISVTADPSIFQMHRMVQIATQRWAEQGGRLKQWQSLLVYNLRNAYRRLGQSNLELNESPYPHTIDTIAVDVPMGAARSQHLSLLLQHLLLLIQVQWYAQVQGYADAQVLRIDALNVKIMLETN